MTLTEWIDEQRMAMRCTRNGVYQYLAERLLELGTPVSIQTISAVDRGMKLKTYDRAKALSEATNGQVTVQELCE